MGIFGIFDALVVGTARLWSAMFMCCYCGWYVYYIVHCLPNVYLKCDLNTNYQAMNFWIHFNISIILFHNLGRIIFKWWTPHVDLSCVGVSLMFTQMLICIVKAVNIPIDKSCFVSHICCYKVIIYIFWQYL